MKNLLIQQTILVVFLQKSGKFTPINLESRN